MMDATYHDQLQRVFRSFTKLPKDADKKEITVEEWDDYYHFFQDAYHLCDWIMQDEHTGVTEEHIKKFIENEWEMRLLKDIVNNIKHFELTWSTPHFKNIALGLRLENGETFPGITYEEEGFMDIEEDGTFKSKDGIHIEMTTQVGAIHPKDLAVKVVEAWMDFLKQQILAGNLKTVKNWDILT